MSVGLCRSASVGTSGQIAVAQRAGNPNAVYVDTRDSAGNPADRFFHLVVVR